VPSIAPSTDKYIDNSTESHNHNESCKLSPAQKSYLFIETSYEYKKFLNITAKVKTL